MPVFLEAILVAAAMIAGFFGVFFLIFLLALVLLPVEKSVSKVVWDLTTPARPPVIKGAGFKDFSNKHR
jgi:hypothetical protein